MTVAKEKPTKKPKEEPTKITKATIESAWRRRAKGQRLVIRDAECRGLALVVNPNGMTWKYDYKPRGLNPHTGKRWASQTVTIGNPDTHSPDQARGAANAAKGQAAAGGDPAADKRTAAEAKRLERGNTMERLIDDWTRLHLSSRKPRYQAEAVGTLRRVFTAWLNRPAAQLTRRDVVAILDRLPPSMGRAAAAYGRACFAWGVKRDGVVGNPFVSLPVQATVRRDRVLDDAEAAAVWKAAAGTPAPFGPIVCLLLLTGQRKEEVGSMAWEEVAADLATWTIPAERTKNGQPSVVPLSAPAQSILQARLALVGKQRRGLVFPGDGGTKAKNPAFQSWSKAKAKLDFGSGVAEWRLHDLRRTVATGLQRLGVRLEVTEAVLNHVSGSRGGLTGIYQRHDWAAEKRAALDGWGAHLMAVLEAVGDIVAAGKIVAMQRSKRAA